MTKIIRGANTGGKGGGGGGRTPTTEADSLDSKSDAKVLDLICEGEIEGLKDGLKSVFLNNTPIQNNDGTDNFSGVGYEFRNGGSIQERIPGFDAAATTVSVNRRITKDADNNIGETETVATSPQPNQKVRVVIKLPSLQNIEDDGDITGTEVQFKIQMSVDNGGFVDKKTETIKGRTGDMYKKAYTLDIPSSFNTEVKIRIVRLTDNASDNTRLMNETWWDTWVRLIYSSSTYPNCALAAISIDAQQFSSIPQRAYLVRGAKIRIPNNATVDSETGALIYSGTWNGVLSEAVWCADPAWCLWDLLTSRRYGLGDHVLTLAEQADPQWAGQAERLSKFDFYAASQYCSANNTRPNNANNDYGASGRHGIADGFGGFEPRFSCNVYIQGRAEAFDLINSMAAVFRAMPYWSVGSLAMAQDKPQSSSYLFTLANITSEGFTYSGSSQRSRATAVVVKYFDKTLRTFAYEVVEDDNNMFGGQARYGVITKNVEAFACTSRSQARRVGKWLIFSEAKETEVVSFTCSLEAGVLVRPGQVIDVADPLKAGLRRGGRITAATASQITVDGTAGVDTDLPQGSSVGYTRTIHVLMSNGTVESRTVSSIVGNVIVPDTAFSSAPNVNGVWVLETSGGSSAQNLQTTQWRVVGIEEVDDLEYKVSALAYNGSKFASIETGETLTQRDFSNLNEIPAPPTGLNIVEQLYKQADQVKSKLVISWENVLGVSKYEVRWRKDNSDWHVYTKIGTNDEIPDITAGSFEIRIYSLNATGVPSAVPLSNTTIATGKDRSPSNITNFTYTLDPKLGFILHWDKLVATYPYFDDLDVVGYEIRTTDAEWGLDNNDYYNFVSPVAGENLIARVTANSYNLGFTPPSTTAYYIKAYDSQGTYSVNAASLSITILAPLEPTASATIEGNSVVITWTRVSEVGRYAIDYYQVSKTSDFSTILETLDTTVYKREVDFTGQQNFYVRAVDISGMVSPGNIAAAHNTQASNYGLAVNYDSGTSADLTWSERNGSTPTVAYEIAHSPASITSFAEATGNQRIQGTAFSYSVVGKRYGTTSQWTTTRKFWIRSVDGQGNTGAEEYYELQFAMPNAVQNLTTAFKAEGNALLKSELELKWEATNVRGSLNIEEYEIYRGANFASATLVLTIKALVATTQVDWNGTETFWVRAMDINGNPGTAVSIPATVTPPAAVGSFAQEVIDNNVLLNWSAAESILPILYYSIKKQQSANLPLDTIDNFKNRGEDIGTKQGLFTTVFETIAGTYTYWIAAIDSANNTGHPVSITSSVNQPPDYILRKNVNSIFESQPSVPTIVTKTNAFADQGFLFVNVDTSRTYQDHFIGDGSSGSPEFPNWNSFGPNEIYGLPSAQSGDFEEILDYGTTLAGTKVTMTFTGQHVAGGATTTAKISTSPTGPSDTPAGSYNWTDFPLPATTSSIITHSAFGTAFRYIKFKFDFVSTGRDDLLKVTSLNMRLDTKQITDSGNGAARTERAATYTKNGTTITIAQNSHGYAVNQLVSLNFTSGTHSQDGVYKVTAITTNTFTVSQYYNSSNILVTVGSSNTNGNVTLDAGGTALKFNLDFVDVASITVTPSGTTPLIAIYDFLDNADPVFFKVLLYDTSGNRSNGNFSWTARGN